MIIKRLRHRDYSLRGESIVYLDLRRPVETNAEVQSAVRASPGSILVARATTSVVHLRMESSVRSRLPAHTSFAFRKSAFVIDATASSV